jgi:hypothetical protein
LVVDQTSGTAKRCRFRNQSAFGSLLRGGTSMRFHPNSRASTDQRPGPYICQSGNNGFCCTRQRDEFDATHHWRVRQLLDQESDPALRDAADRFAAAFLRRVRHDS